MCMKEDKSCAKHIKGDNYLWGTRGILCDFIHSFCSLCTCTTLCELKLCLIKYLVDNTSCHNVLHNIQIILLIRSSEFIYLFSVEIIWIFYFYCRYKGFRRCWSILWCYWTSVCWICLWYVLGVLDQKFQYLLLEPLRKTPFEHLTLRDGALLN